MHSASNAKLWEVTDLSASEFADEVARFYNERVALQDMLSATPLCGLKQRPIGLVPRLHAAARPQKLLMRLDQPLALPSALTL